MKFSRTPIVFCVLLTSSFLAEAEEEIRIREIRITPTAEAKPALKYKLLPTTQELKLLDATPLLEPMLKATNDRWAKVHDSLPDRYEKSPFDLDKATVDRMAKIVEDHKDILDLADRVKLCDRCHWNTKFRTARLAAAAEMDEVQNVRSVARFVDLRSRLLIAKGDWKGALESVQTQLMLAKHCASHPAIVGGLVAIAMESIALDNALAAAQLASCPNLYWPLSALPDPLFDFARIIQGEIQFNMNHIPEVRDADRTKKSNEEWLSIIERYIADTVFFPNSSPYPERYHKLLARLLMLRAYTPAKEHLRSQGWAEIDIEAMPTGQAVAILLRDEYLAFGDDFLKWYSLPPHVAVENFDDKIWELEYANTRNQIGVALTLMPSVTSAILAQWNVRHFRTHVRTIEAIRLHAHQNGGRLPASLNEIKCVPIPLDPYTNKPLEYSLKDGVAELRPNAAALKKSLRAQPTRVFRIRIAKEPAK